MGKPGYLRFLYNHNPFYLISACCILYGLHSTLAQNSEHENLWLLSSILAGYCVVMALTSILIVKIGQVWDDARSIFMVLLLIFFSISISFDRLFVTDPQIAASMLLGGLVFCSLIAELILRLLKIKFPAVFRLPFYLILLLIFAYPILFTLKQQWYPAVSNHWLTLAFPTIAGLAILTLIPAAKSGRRCVAKNGTPWNWPLYPWSVFFMLIIGLSLRTAVLCIAFEPKLGFDSSFGTYHLIPIFLSICVLVLESSIAENNKMLKRLALWLPLLSIPMAFHWHSNPVYDACVGELELLAGSPIWITSVLLMAYYTIAWIRSVDSEGVFATFACCVATMFSNGINETLSLIHI